MNKLLTILLLNKFSKSSSGGSVYPPDWSEIGYEDTPESVINGFNYAKTIKDNWDDSITSMASLYRNDYELLVFPLVDTSNVTNMEYTFTYSNIREIPLLNTSKVGSFASMFESCYSLMSVPKINTSHSTSFSGMFKYCSSLENVPIFDCSNAVNMKNMFSSCGKLTNESLNNIMAICINVTRVSTSNKTLSYLGLSSAQATICQSLSNYSAFTSAGWTTGY